MREIIPGLYELTRGANIYLLETAPDELTIVDTGIPGSTSTILDAVQQLGKVPADIKHILITHADFDHVGSLAGLVEATGARVYASEKSVPYIENKKSPPHIPAPISWITTPLQKVFLKKATVDNAVRDGQTLAIGGGIQVIATPGHTPDNISYYWETRAVVFAADLLNTQGDVLSLTPPLISWDMDAARESARRVMQHKPAVICVGHGDAVNLSKHPSAADALLRQLNPRMKAAGA